MGNTSLHGVNKVGGLAGGQAVVQAWPLPLKRPSPIKLPIFASLLCDYPDRSAAKLLWTGFCKGFRIPSPYATGVRIVRNLPSVLGHEAVVRAKLCKEVALGRVLDSFKDHPLPNLIISPLGVVPKKAPGKYWLIHHLSFPSGASVNNGIPKELCTVQYTSFDQAVCMVQGCGTGAFMAKCNIELAFRLLPIHGKDFSLLGIHFEGQLYFDTCLPMGCSLSCTLFELFSSMLEWAVRQRCGLKSTAHYLDDFLWAGPAGSGQCKALLTTFVTLAG